jgi:hypothetical protein
LVNLQVAGFSLIIGELRPELMEALSDFTVFRAGLANTDETSTRTIDG